MITTDQLNTIAKERIKQQPKLIFEYILIASYCYYNRFSSIFADEAFDKLCSICLKHYEKIESPYKHLVTEDALRAGSCFHLKIEDYPPRLVFIGEEILRNVDC